MDFQGPLSQQVKGIALIVIGSILVLNQLGILTQSLDFYVVLFIALYLIVLGIIKVDTGKKLQKFIQKDQ